MALDSAELARRQTELKKYGVTKIPREFIVFPSFDDVIMNLVTYGFADIQVGSVLGRHPNIFNYTLERTDAMLGNLEKQRNLEDALLSREEVITIVTIFPSVLGNDSERTSQIIKICHEIGWDYVMKPHVFIKNPESLRTRMAIMWKHGDDPAKNRWVLFADNAKFERHYPIFGASSQ